MRLNARKINHRMKQSLQFKTTTKMPRRTPLHYKQHNKEFISLEEPARTSPKYLVEAPTKTDTTELEAQVSSKSKLFHNKKRYSDYNIKREGESTIDFSTRLNAHIIASKNKSAKTGGSKRQKRNRTTIINDQDKSTDFHSNMIPLIQTTPTTTKETPCYGIENSPMTLNETLESAKGLVDDGIESRNDQETNDYMINDDLKTESESEQLCALWTKNKQLAHEVFNMQEAVRDQSFECNVRSLSESNARNSDTRKRSPFFLDDPQFDLPLEEQTQQQRNHMNQNDLIMEYLHMQYMMLHRMSTAYVDQCNHILGHIMDTYSSELSDMQWRTLLTRLLHTKPIPQLEFKSYWKR
jgi:hypothetical protein